VIAIDPLLQLVPPSGN